jgi:hypothetical protein
MREFNSERRRLGWLVAALLVASGICATGRAGDYPPYYRPWYASPYRSYGSYYRPWYASPWAYSLYRPSYYAAPYYNGPYYAWPRYYRHEEVFAWPCPPEAIEPFGPAPAWESGYGGCYYW